MIDYKNIAIYIALLIFGYIGLLGMIYFYQNSRMKHMIRKYHEVNAKRKRNGR